MTCRSTPVTQAWLAVSDDPAATVERRGSSITSGRSRCTRRCAHRQFQDELLGALAELTGAKLPD